ncbi:MAG: c-type cytochrome [Candidatus Nitrospinota bacterium M3_3B_026]
MSNQRNKGLAFLWVLGTLAAVLALIKFGVPAVSRKMTGLEFPLTVPSTLFLFYTILILIGAFVYVTSDEGMLEDFMTPIRRTYGGEYGMAVLVIVAVLVPVAAGAGVFYWVKPTIAPPVALRIQHPSSNFPKKFENAENPMANPTDAEVDEFVEQVKNDSVEFFPQVHEKGRTFTNIDHIPTGPVKRLLKELEGGSVSRETAREALIEKRLFEGRAMYEVNCRPCHGDSVAGDGPMAYGFSLRPINFTDNGTIETIVEGYTFWRVSTGGLGLPVESTPWDSAMPVWELDLSGKERWTIIMGEYNLAEKTPRIREKLE